MLGVLLLLTCSAPIVLGQRVESSECSAFSTDGLAASDFQYYRFYDFRNISTSGAERRVGRRQSGVAVTNRTVSDDSWAEDWYVRDYPRASPGGHSIPVNFTPERVEIGEKIPIDNSRSKLTHIAVKSTDESENYSTYLSLSTARIDAEDQESGEITFAEYNVTAASIRVYCRVQGAPGAVAGIFTYQNDTQESDIELFTRAPANFVQYSNQPASSGEPDWLPIPGATVNNTLPKHLRYSEWVVHRLDWVPGRSVFFANNEQTNTTELHVPVADPPSVIYVDMWSSNSTWSGSMELGESAALDVQWIELVFNATDDVVEERPAGRVCAVDAIDIEAVDESGAVSGPIIGLPMMAAAGLLAVAALL